MPAAYHVIARFVAGEWFVKSDHERNAYLRLLEDALKVSDWRLFAYAVMSNHIHLAVGAGRTARTRWLRNTHSPFGAWINDCNERFGAVFAKGTLALPIPRDAVASVVAYIHNNPVRAGVVHRARDSTWTSHQAYLGLCKPPRMLCVGLGYELMQMDDPFTFDRFVNDDALRPRAQHRRRGRPARAR